jgi:outer membrane lipoprotein LolB
MAAQCARRLRAGRSIAMAAFAVLAAACASVPETSVPVATTAADAPFSIGGRISARRGDAGVAGGFAWVHDAGHDAIDLATPLGQTLARLEGDGSAVSVRLQDGRVENASTWAELTERAFGVTIPVEGLSAWVRGVPRADARFTVERDAAGRVSVLRQDGWEIVYAYADDTSQRPLRVSLNYPGAEPVEVRVVVDRWN